MKVNTNTATGPIDSDLDVCACCIQILANGSTEGGHTQAEEAASVAGIDRIQSKEKGRLVVLSDCGDDSAIDDFSPHRCPVCRALPGARYVVALIPA